MKPLARRPGGYKRGMVLQEPLRKDFLLLERKLGSVQDGATTVCQSTIVIANQLVQRVPAEPVRLERNSGVVASDLDSCSACG